MKEDGVINNNDDDVMIRIDEAEEQEDEDDVDLLVDAAAAAMDDDEDDDDVRLQGLFRQADGADENCEEEEESQPFAVGQTTSGISDNGKRRRLETKNTAVLVVHEDAILDCFQLAVASHDAAAAAAAAAAAISHLVHKQGDVDDLAPSISTPTSRSDSFRWTPPRLYASTTPETDSIDTTQLLAQLADWRPQPLELPLWALALVRPRNMSLQEKQHDNKEETNH
jgi:hypothetical protein